jgi:hypothetical protein
MNDAVMTLIILPVFAAGAFLVRGRAGRRKEAVSRLKRVTEAMRVTAGIVPARLKREKVDREIYDAISFVRNIASAGPASSPTAAGLLEQFADRGGTLGAASLKALALVRVNRLTGAAQVFAETAGTKSAQDFIGILLRFDRVSPDKLATTLAAYQAAMKEFRTTRLKRRSENLSDLVFLPVIVNVMVVFMNFIIVAYFLSQKSQLTEMFF